MLHLSHLWMTLFNYLSCSEPKADPSLSFSCLPFEDKSLSLSPGEWYDLIRDDDYRPELIIDETGNGIPKQVIEMIKKGWISDPYERCTAAELLNVLAQATGRPVEGPLPSTDKNSKHTEV